MRDWDYKAIKRCQYQMPLSREQDQYFDCGEPATYVILWKDVGFMYICIEHLNQMKREEGDDKQRV
jgi:hypothetical protein